MIFAEIPVQFFYKNASIWALFASAFIILIIDKCVQKDENALPVFFTALGGVIISLLSSLSLVHNAIQNPVNINNFVENLGSISVVFINFALIFLTFIIYGQKIINSENAQTLNLSQELFYLLTSGLGANLAASADNIIIMLSGIFVLFVAIFASFYISNQKLKIDSEVLNEQKAKNIFWLPFLSIFIGVIFFIFGAVLYSKSQNTFSIAQSINTQNEGLSAISFIFFWISFIIFAGILPFSRWIHRITENPLPSISLRQHGG